MTDRFNGDANTGVNVNLEKGKHKQTFDSLKPRENNIKRVRSARSARPETSNNLRKLTSTKPWESIRPLK
jgi:hypothetical protein